MALQEPESAREGSGTVPKGFEATTGAPEEHDARSGSVLSSSLLSLGWEIADDGGDGNKFFFNVNTGESRWDPPTPDDAPDARARLSKGDEQERALPGAGERGGAAEAVGGDAESTPEDDTSQQHDAPPVGWEAVVAEDGGVYYHQMASGLTRWEFPREGDGEEQVGDNPRPVAPEAGSAGWEEFKTEEGVPFWYNANTGESCWTLPGDPT